MRKNHTQQAATKRTRAGRFLWVPAMLAAVLFTSPPYGSGTEISPPQLSSVKIPQDIGYVSGLVDVPGPAEEGKVIFLIQDAHVNYEAQRSLAAILEHLIVNYGLRLVLVEGYEGDVSLKPLRRTGDKAARAEVADSFLKAGFISGEEYLDIVSDYNLILWGVEDLELFQINSELLLDSGSLESAAIPGLEAVAEMTSRLKGYYFSDELRLFELRSAEFHEEDGDLGEYVAWLVDQGDAVQVASEVAPHVHHFVELNQLEGSIDYARVGEERRLAVEALRGKASAVEMELLVKLAKQLKAQEINAQPFYGMLLGLIESHHIPQGPLQSLARYARYLELKGAMDIRSFMREIGDLEREIKTRMVRSDDERELLNISEGLDLYRRLFGLKWTSSDYQRYLKYRAQWKVELWVPELRRLCVSAGIDMGWNGDGAMLDGQIESVVRFYATAEKRDAEMLARTLDKMVAERQQVAALIAGGFHTGNLSTMLREQGVRLAIITPRSGDEADNARYRRIVRFKYEDYQRAQGRGGSNPDPGPE